MKRSIFASSVRIKIPITIVLSLVVAFTVRTGIAELRVRNSLNTSKFDAASNREDMEHEEWPAFVETINPFAERVEYDPRLGSTTPDSRGEAIAERLAWLLEQPAGRLAFIAEETLQTRHDTTPAFLRRDAIPLQQLPGQPQLLIDSEAEPFLRPGALPQGIEIPTGAIWRPALWVFGTYQTGINVFRGPTRRATEWSNRLDLFSQLNFTGTERVLLGLRPLDKERRNQRRFTGYDFRRGRAVNAGNMDVQTLFFEGDYGEIFPFIDPLDLLAQDFGFSVGRQPMSFQQGMLINDDRLDAMTLTRNTLSGNGILNMRATAVYAWDNITRSNNLRDHDAQLIGVFTESDTRTSTINADIAYVHSPSSFGSLLTVGLSSIRRFECARHTFNSSLHFLSSFPTDGETTASSQGELLFSQLSWTPEKSKDIVYLNAFWAVDEFTSAARGPQSGGPLGQTGILFAAAGLGNFGAALDNRARKSVGGSLGYQLFFCDTRQQLTFEVGTRIDTDSRNNGELGAGFRYQRALDQHWMMVVDSFVAKRESHRVSPGTRFNLQMKF